jgi:hypothetical protein
MTTYINPPTECDLCKADFDLDMYDASARVPGRLGRIWANLCEDCFACCDGHLGTGRGQHYQRQPDGKWLKIAG